MTIDHSCHATFASTKNIKSFWSISKLLTQRKESATSFKLCGKKTI